MKEVIYTEKAPPCIGTYSQAIKVGNLVYLSGQIPIDPATEKLITGDMKAQVTQVFKNLKAVSEAAGANLNSIVRLCIYLTDLAHFPIVNDIMKEYFTMPYPARSTLGVAALPKGAAVEMDAILVVGN